jgi:hypothetical protein
MVVVVNFVTGTIQPLYAGHNPNNVYAAFYQAAVAVFRDKGHRGVQAHIETEAMKPQYGPQPQ